MIANMGFAEAANLPVILIGDIERGGVIAGIVGSWVLLDDADRSRLKGYIVNKFRGDPALFDPAIDEIGLRTGMPCNGVVPWFADASRLPAEDSMALAGMTSKGPGAVKIAVPVLPRIANFDDLDPVARRARCLCPDGSPGRSLARGR